jgi:hypothetical protein
MACVVRVSGFYLKVRLGFEIVTLVWVNKAGEKPSKANTLNPLKTRKGAGNTLKRISAR